MKKYSLILIILLAFVLRFYKLGTTPALNADEATIGYNAYSLLLTGKDEHGNSWPVHFQSFNDYKPGLYFYVVLPFVKVLGLNVWSVRIPGALLGVLAVLIIYLLTKELFKDEKISVFSALLLAISPWHIHFSRGGWEVNLATFLITLGVWLFLKYVNSTKSKYLFLSVLVFAVSLYSYHAARIVVPLLGLSLVVIYQKVIFNKSTLKLIIFNLLFLVLLLLPLIKDLMGPAGISRAAGVGLFADPGPLNRINEQRGEHFDFTSITPKAFHNKAVNYGLAFLSNWVAHYHGEFLFLSGDKIQRNKVPETGQLYLFEIITVALGIIILLRKFDMSSKVVFSWLLIAPVASALTFQSPHALRAHNMVIPITIISAVGLSYLVSWLRKMNFKFVMWLLIFIIAWPFTRYEHMYWVHMPKEYSYSSQYGLKELVDFVKKNESVYKNIVISDRYDQPYILFLFYSKYDPVVFQKENILTLRDQFGFSTVREFGKYRFITFGKWEEVRGSYPNSLIIGTPTQIPQEANIIKRIYGSNGFEYFDLVAN